MRGHERHVLAACLALYCSCAESSRHPSVLEVVGARGVIWNAPVQKGERFDVTFVHSAEHCNWTQHYRVGSAGEVEQLSSTFSAFGAGMPVTMTDDATVIESPEGYTVRAERRLRRIQMMAWQKADIAILYRGRRVPIGPQLEDFEPFSLVVRAR